MFFAITIYIIFFLERHPYRSGTVNTPFKIHHVTATVDPSAFVSPAIF